MKWFPLTLAALFLITGAAMAERIEIGNDQLRQLQRDEIPVVDIRTAPEWRETGIVEGSHLLTFFHADGSYDAQTFLTRLKTIADRDEPLILICRTGRRTGLVSNFLVQQAGYNRVYNLSRGIRHWIDQGNPTVKPR